MTIAGNKLRQRKNGIWELRIMRVGTSISFYGKTQEIVRSKYSEWIKTNEKPKQQKAITVAIWCDTWVSTYKKGKIKPSTMTSLNGLIRRYIVPYLGEIPLIKLKNVTIQEFFNSIENMGNTKNKVNFYLKDILDKALLNGLIKKNPLIGVEVKKSTSKHSVALSRDSQQILKSYKFEDERLHFLYLFILYTGCRKSEALAFNYTTDIKNDILHIKGTKTHKSDRYIPYFQSIKELFNGNDTINFNDISSDYATRKIKLALPNHTVMDLRTTFATNCHELGVSPKVVQKWLGHTNLNMTMNVYTQVQKDFELSEAEKLVPKLVPK